MRIVRNLVRATDIISEAAFRVALMSLVGLFVLDTIRIFFRYFLSMPMNWVPGIVALLGNWVVFLGVGVYLYRNEVIVIDYFYEKFIPVKGRKYVDAFVNLLVITFTLLVIRFSWAAILDGNHQSSLSTLKINYYWYSIPMLLGMLLGLAGSLKRLLIRE